MDEERAWRIVAAVEGALSRGFLERYPEWKRTVLARGTTGVTPSDLRSFEDVDRALGEDAALQAAIAKLGERARLRVVGEGGRVTRSIPLQGAGGAARGAVVAVEPVHGDATEDQLRRFFSPIGFVEDVAWGPEVSRNRYRVFIEFAAAEAAQACVRDQPQYKRTGTISDQFLPKLQSAAAQASELSAGASERAEEVSQSAGGGSGRPPGGAAPAAGGRPRPPGFEPYLKKGLSLKMRGIGPGMSTIDLGNLVGQRFCPFKRQIDFVHIEGDTAYIVFKRKESLDAVLDNFRAVPCAVGGSVPSLSVVRGDEEERVRELWKEDPRRRKRRQQNQWKRQGGPGAAPSADGGPPRAADAAEPSMGRESAPAPPEEEEDDGGGWA
eukprot:TRINITY_DN71130_c0_g1_i1.p1 TRINITY_DN71130_c0_g1~~TRINITY_DN71130_c0_g1_i1.p1  ORF type:complete len:402 (+),score=136.63 TRINITY_DN71130_c0_g1_i1:62-1207(+)